MKFILTNDDGYDAPGLDTLTRIVEPLGDTVVAAPAEEQSGIGHQLTTHKPIRVEQWAERRFRIHGFPADCTRIALSQLAPEADWVVAGINQGGNLGADVYTSGTVAAVREAALMGRRAIALSHYVARDRPVDWEVAAQRVGPILQMLLTRDLPTGFFWNVNFPHPEGSETALEYVFCAVDPSPLAIGYERQDGLFTYTGNYHERPWLPGRDVDVCLSGRIAVSLIPVDITPE